MLATGVKITLKQWQEMVRQVEEAQTQGRVEGAVKEFQYR